MSTVFNDYKHGDLIKITVKMPTGNQLNIQDVPGFGSANIDVSDLKKHIQHQDEKPLRIVKKYANGAFGGHWWEAEFSTNAGGWPCVVIIPSNIFELYEDDFSNLDLSLDI